jgi:hypothetical protein
MSIVGIQFVEMLKDCEEGSTGWESSQGFSWVLLAPEVE